MESITRRTFLSLSGLAALSLAARFPSLEDNPPPAAFVKLGRATRSLRCYDKPAFSAQEICTHHTDSVLNIHEEKLGETDNPHNAIWFQVDDGWVYSSFVQPVKSVLNSPLQSVPATGRLVEVTVPFTEAWRNEDGELSIAYRFYYNSTHWVEGVVTDPKGNAWYRVLDDRYRVYYYVLAKHLRPVADDELAPLAQDTTDKRVEIDLTRQQLAAYEDGVRYVARTCHPAARAAIHRWARFKSGLSGLRVTWPPARAPAMDSICPACRGSHIFTGRV